MGEVSKKYISALRASVWSKNKGGRASRAAPLDPPLPKGLWAPEHNFGICIGLVSISDSVVLGKITQKPLMAVICSLENESVSSYES